METSEEPPRSGENVVAGLVSTGKWMGVVSGTFTLVLWVMHCFDLSASLDYDKRDFFNDVNARGWRKGLFSLDSEVFWDAWTPFIMGMMSLLMHTERFQMPVFTSNWCRFGFWHAAVCLFANLGYNGIAGLVVGAFTALTALIAFLLVCFHRGPAHLFTDTGKPIHPFYAWFILHDARGNNRLRSANSRQNGKTPGSVQERFPPKRAFPATPAVNADLQDTPATTDALPETPKPDTRAEDTKEEAKEPPAEA
ncbi:hypothetical protein NCLIV_013480 [Neospora caninum Liverpool]|uniref:Transmembrane protein n=1 Tax=Neospora caninum (strain Liverpool) TaxID=572307 RepID=F0VD40_NEOCL|nr:hypothetical protein NCLIV_013480 [Neospora caninum Liverpool]CBZ51555.1 hypothetical protein NCLIV_013480 [Neospora caninum Liverpool]CEL65506.1 TPA: hypothetical protein BN1204_013480 [Neospora caninum Liverpool]|eukprot:XP_003881588.1 hypothetical protein NCLIV_013480 [Neospora caninum Liverpool]